MRKPSFHLTSDDRSGKAILDRCPHVGGHSRALTEAISATPKLSGA